VPVLAIHIATAISCKNLWIPTPPGKPSFPDTDCHKNAHIFAHKSTPTKDKPTLMTPNEWRARLPAAARILGTSDQKLREATRAKGKGSTVRRNATLSLIRRSADLARLLEDQGN
jgi:hypothetical protein